MTSEKLCEKWVKIPTLSQSPEIQNEVQKLVQFLVVLHLLQGKKQKLKIN